MRDFKLKIHSLSESVSFFWIKSINFCDRLETVIFLVNRYTSSEKFSSSIRFTLQFHSPAISMALSDWDAKMFAYLCEIPLTTKNEIKFDVINSNNSLGIAIVVSK